MSDAKLSQKSLTYDQALERLYQVSLVRRGTRTCKTAEALHQILGRPAAQFPSIHIGGTNGKSSVATKIAKALELSGYKTGLYTSPHLLCFRERIRINQDMISEKSVAEGLDYIFELTQKLHIKPTFFEIATNLAARYFALEQIDVGVFEVGIGGRRDATNIINPILSVITNISADHTDILGETLEQIAFEKAGIMRSNIPVVIGPHAQFRPITEKADILIQVPETEGNFEIENRNIAKTALKQLQLCFKISDATIETAIKATPPCRLEEAQYQGATFIMDVAHNEEAIARLLQAVEVRYPRSSLQAIYGMSQGKDWEACLKQIAQKARHIHLPFIPHHRLVSPDLLHKLLRDMGYMHATWNISAKQALSAATARAKEFGDLVIICGSFYMMESFISLIRKTKH